MEVPWKPLGEVASYIRGVTFGPDDPVPPGAPGSAVCMRTKNIQELLDETDLIAVPERFVRRDEQWLRAGDILVSSANSWNLVGKCARVSELTHRATAGGFISILRADPVRLDPGYLFRWLSSDRTQHRVRQCARQTTNIANLSAEQFLSERLPLPPLPEQRRIAATLDKADAMQRKRGESIRLAEQFLRSAFLERFGDPVRNPRGWPIRRIDEIARVTTGNTPPRDRPQYYGTAIEWIKSDNINTLEHTLTRSAEGLSVEGLRIARTADAGATLMTCIAGTPECIGNVALADRRVAFNQQINAILPEKGTDPHFLYAELLLAKRMVQRFSTASMKGMVSKSRLSALQIPIPPFEQQRRFGSWFEAFLCWRQAMVAAAKEGQDVLRSTSQRAFRGDLHDDRTRDASHPDGNPLRGL